MRVKMEAAQRDKIKQTIKNQTKHIIETDGIEGVSIRKVAKMVGYTPANLYQYYANKTSLIDAVVEEGYLELLGGIVSPYNRNGSIQQQIIERFKQYTENAIQKPDYYKAVMLSDNPNIVSKTSVLNYSSPSQRKAIDFLIDMIDQGIRNKEFITMNAQAFAQLLWTSNFGLTLRIIIENYSNSSQIEYLIEQQFELLFRSVKNHSKESHHD